MGKKLIYVIYVILFQFSLTNTMAICNSRDSGSIRKDSGIYIAFNYLASIPLGYFRSTIYSGAFAMNGNGLNIEIEHPVKPGWLGLTFESGYYINPFNFNALNTEFNSIPQLGVPEYTLSNASPYKEIPILAGTFLKTRYKKFSFQFMSMVGIDITYIASIYAIQPRTKNILILEPLNNTLLSQPLIIPFFSYNLEGSIQYPIDKYISVYINIGYFNDFNFYYDYFSNYYYYFPLSQLHIGIGMSYHFNK